ncbi:hypothetical protein GQ54DRAFT_297618 [Martensiomyces pterosporus]|nr:hypothetical protein GQ54DRAFT_297618 [Martensiomyces pterosporus]
MYTGHKCIVAICPAEGAFISTKQQPAGVTLRLCCCCRFGPGPRGYLGTIGQYALGSGASFGFFMMIGSCIRSDEDRMLTAEDRAVLKASLVDRWRAPAPGPMAYYMAKAAKSD